MLTRGEKAIIQLCSIPDARALIFFNAKNTCVKCNTGINRYLISIEEGFSMQMNLYLGSILSIIAGILILVMPRLLNYIVAIYLILIGLAGILGYTRFY